MMPKQKDTIQLDATLTRAEAMALLRVLQQVTWPKVFPDAKPDRRATALFERANDRVRAALLKALAPENTHPG